MKDLVFVGFVSWDHDSLYRLKEISDKSYAPLFRVKRVRDSLLTFGCISEVMFAKKSISFLNLLTYATLTIAYESGCVTLPVTPIMWLELSENHRLNNSISQFLKAYRVHRDEAYIYEVKSRYPEIRLEGSNL